jgi:hypothetical protein
VEEAAAKEAAAKKCLRCMVLNFVGQSVNGRASDQLTHSCGATPKAWAS